ncbi:Hcp family type VI secretion system effector [Escherichia sp. E4694]|nr:Hcp family type VI secretion system effector [Escherichia sp. E5028]TGB89162.1 Hcp family type VI secretion system effector [Escherichia sp. E3356]TGC12748.1 Hcp family type VI secretion system effector [Escherichia sp. E2562]TLI78115.1 Hcp family type VI secretion system effector [Escherichia sp. E2562]TLI90531.1 Hcp family type VI secretion system effector [Escherichia sp. E4694]
MAIPVYLWLKDDGGADIKDASFKKHNHLEQIELHYEKITWTYKDGNIIHSDSWNERTTA